MASKHDRPGEEDKTHSFPPNLRISQILTVVIVVLAVVASVGGLFIPGLYRDPQGVLLAIQGHDLVTLIAMPVMPVRTS